MPKLKTYQVTQTLTFYIKAQDEEQALEEFGEYDNSMAKHNDVEIEEA